MAEIQTRNPPWMPVSNPVDTWMAVLKQGLAAANLDILNLLLQDANVDGAVVLLNAYRSTGYESLRELVDGIVATQQRFADKPIALWAFGMNRHGVIEEAEKSGVVAGFGSPDSAARALAGLYRYHHEIKARQLDAGPELKSTDADRAAAILQRAEADAVEVLGTETLEILESYGISTARAVLATNEQELLEIGNALGYPLVMKIASEQIVHKSDVGGVRLNIAGPDELVESFAEMCTSIQAGFPDAVIAGVHLQRQHSEGVETIIGASRHAGFGPVIVFGLGGIFTEILKDVSFAMAPVSRSEAIAMISRLRAQAVLAGARGGDAVDTDVIVDAIVRVSKLLWISPRSMNWISTLSPCKSRPGSPSMPAPY